MPVKKIIWLLFPFDKLFSFIGNKKTGFTILAMIDLQVNITMPIVYFTATVSLVLLGCVFLASGVSKVFAHQQFASTLQQLGLVPNSFIRPLSVLVPILEIGVAITIVWGNVRIGILAGIILLGIFIVVTVVAIRLGRTNVECSCFGPFSRETFGSGIIVQNVALSVLGIFVLAICSFLSGGLSVVMSNRISLPVLFPALAIFPIYSLSKYFLSNRRYYQKDSPILPVHTIKGG